MYNKNNDFYLTKCVLLDRGMLLSPGKHVEHDIIIYVMNISRCLRIYYILLKIIFQYVMSDFKV